MKETSPPEIPYRLETTDAILAAMQCNLLDIGSGYKIMLAVAKKTRLHPPPALLNARKSVIKDFALVRERKEREGHVQYHEIAHLGLINDFRFIEAAIPWAKHLTEHADIFSFVRTLSQDAQKFCQMEHPPSTPAKMLDSALALRKLVRMEMLTYMASEKTKHMTIEEFKQILVAYSFYDPRNEDVLNALKSSELSVQSVLYQNALAELLFVRLPKSMEELFRINPKTIHQKLFSKIAKLNITGKQRVMLNGFFPPNIAGNKLLPELHKIDEIAQKISLTKEVKANLHEYISSLIHKIKQSQLLYGELFLDKELEVLHKLHRPGNVMQCKVSYMETLIRTYTHLATLQFYPTKDYLDLFRQIASDDCVGVSLGEQHLMTPNFFNIRIFNDSSWAGNIYMLDLTMEYGVLLVDRIQIPRGINAYYVNFFQDLGKMFQEMFADVDYREILLPLTISNHAVIQKIFNKYKDKLRRRELNLYDHQAEHFESLKNNIYYILCEKC